MLAYEKNLVSIIMPAYNSEKYISSAIESVLNQTYTNFELIVVNDGSTDNTIDILKKYSDRIICISQRNKGAAFARNNGILAARGEYISFLDSDDIWPNDTLKLQYEYLRTHPDVGLVYGEMELFDQTGTLDKNWAITRGRGRPEGYIFQNLILDCLFGLSTVMVRRNVLNNVGLFEESLPLGEDYELWLRIAAKHKVGHIPDILMRYRQHPSSLTSINISIKPWEIAALEKALKKFHDEARLISASKIKKRFAELYFENGYNAFLQKHYSISRYNCLKSLSQVPGNWRAIFYLFASSCYPKLIHLIINTIKQKMAGKLGNKEC